ncbi:class I SAM-dependent methyltransferase [Catelliglobosispora koreensis]|uniref:class I SAM-dependent methyltransferase n=1 Tax=Catelliglobosispora koreensis TaxID=129052 RepID=UPI000377C5A5|nr:class I SAM-dependent methyltransferase [Catelliglobosispora koreensis]
MTTVFGDVASSYQDIRPAYSENLTSYIKAYHSGPLTSVTEIGAGTGLGTAVLLPLGAPVTCIEPDPRMSALLPSAATVFTGTFTDWTPPPGGVDLLACAMAWHWLDPQTRCAQAFDALAPGGTLAVFGHKYCFADPAQSAALDPAYAAGGNYHRERPQFWVYDDVTGSGLFTGVQCHVLSRDLTLTTEQFLTLTGTFSPFLRRPAEEQATVLAVLKSTIDGFGGSVALDLRTTLVLARRP